MSSKSIGPGQFLDGVMEYNICGTTFDLNAAHSACCQLGSTGAFSYSTSANRSRDNDIWLDGVTCGDLDFAYSCLDSCFCYQLSSAIVQCDPGNVVALTCTFDLDEQDMSLPGNRNQFEEVEKPFVPQTHQLRAQQQVYILSSSLAWCCQA